MLESGSSFADCAHLLQYVVFLLFLDACIQQVLILLIDVVLLDLYLCEVLKRVKVQNMAVVCLLIVQDFIDLLSW